jgi:hypothetical protein
LRLAFSHRGRDGDLELYFGSTSGEVYGSADAGASWFNAFSRLPPIFSLSVSR